MDGVDYSSGRPGGAALKGAGKSFAARYVSHTAGKNITKAEAADLAAHGVWTVLVWETAANRAGAGRAAGVADAKEALTQATAAGMPPGRPLYFAVDWDADPAVVVPYFQGVASVLGLARTGAYGGYRVVKHLLDSQLVTWAWQTAAWSGGRWDARAHIRQPATTVHINGVSCDNDTAQQADFGQWMPGKTPEDDVALTDAQANQLTQIASDTAAVRANLLHINSLDETDTKGNPVEHAAGYYLAHGQHDALAAFNAAVKAQTPAVTLTGDQLDALAAKVAPVVAEQLAELLAARLQA